MGNAKPAGASSSQSGNTRFIENEIKTSAYESLRLFFLCLFQKVTLTLHYLNSICNLRVTLYDIERTIFMNIVSAMSLSIHAGLALYVAALFFLFLNGQNMPQQVAWIGIAAATVSYTNLSAHETTEHHVIRNKI